MRTVPDQLRGGMMWLSILLILAAVLFTAVMASARIDSPEEFAISIRQDRVFAVPLAFAVFLLVLTLPRPMFSKRAALAVVTGIGLWLLVWQWLVYGDYSQVRVRGGDPERMLQIARPRS